ncbi:AMP-binding protein [Streptomyces sp. SM13]|uniref:AMP-binding protein n=1 Tax=Streptomyces sp. SM13 TaxID=1983803 RepID=UPI0035BC8551
MSAEGKYRPLIHELVARQAGLTPDAEAVVAGRERLSYGEVEEAAQLLAGHLRGLGAGPETLVGICLGRSPWMVVAMLAVLKAEAAYVPIDPAFPLERRDFILRDSGAELIVTEEALREKWPDRPRGLVSLDRDWDRIALGRPWAGGDTGGDRHLAYALYTSGSTGRPKGVAVEHRSAAAFLDWALDRFTPEEFRYTLASTSMCFDLSVFELFAPLAAGGTVVLAETVFHLPVVAADRPVTLVNTVPSLLLDLLPCGPLPPSVVTVNLAGEALPSALARRLYATGTVRRVHNLYSSSEDTTHSTWSLVGRDADKPSIGRPVTGSTTYILDATGQPVADGEAGELHLGGRVWPAGIWGVPPSRRSASSPIRFPPVRGRACTGPATSHGGCPTATSIFWGASISR